MKDSTGEKWVVQANETALSRVRDATQRLKLPDMRLMALIIAEINPQQDSVDQEIVIRVQDYQQICQLTGGSVYNQLKSSAKQLASLTLEIPDPKKPGKWIFGSFLGSGTYEVGKSEVRVRLNPVFQALYYDLRKQFYKYPVEVIGNIHTAYGLRLYQWIESKKNMQKKYAKFTLQEMRDLLQVPDGKLSRGNHLVTRAVQPAVDAVNETSEFYVTYEPERGGRGGKLIGFVLHWSEKKAGLKPVIPVSEDKYGTRWKIEMESAGGRKKIWETAVDLGITEVPYSSTCRVEVLEEHRVAIFTRIDNPELELASA